MSEKSQSFNGSDKHVQVIARPRFEKENCFCLIKII